MVIDLNSSASQAAMSARDKVSAQKNNGGAGKYTNDTPVAPKPRDTVQLSDTAKALKSIDAQLAQSSDVDSDKVARIKAAIDSGSYTIDAQSIAGKMLSFDAQLAE